ncbi:AhpD family alkylhydroperoxidase [Catenulispora sp. EB89]|uniref:carboxymuconolactone decarboxylase family protein n=1 Tax=Catenulispora sp. EB89 TaxID=3156257 RepID=UPI0035167973
MSANPIRPVLRRTALAQVQRVTPVDVRSARHLVARVYGEMERDFGVLAPPLALHSPAPDMLAASWLTLRETLVADGLAARAAKEVAASAVSLANSCPYCVTVHTATVNSLVRGRDAQAIADDHFDDIGDDQLRAIAAWARDGAVRDTASGLELPFPADQAPELVGVTAVFHYLNRMVNVFLPDVPMPDGTPRSALPVVARVLGTLMRRASRRPTPAGTSADLLPAAALPADLAWAAGAPAVAEAFARAAQAIEQAGREAVPDSVAELLPRVLGAWDGRPPGLDRRWLDQAVAELPGADRAAGRLALLVALASWQVDDQTIAAFRTGSGSDTGAGTASGADRTLILLTSWASFTAARHIASWTPLADHRSVR